MIYKGSDFYNYFHLNTYYKKRFENGNSNLLQSLENDNKKVIILKANRLNGLLL